MAESIYTQLEKSRVITPVEGTDYETPLPDGLFPTAEQFENPADLISWADENDFTAKLIQKGLQKAIIEVRAVYKSCPKDETWTPEMGTKNVEKMKWQDVERPNSKGTKAVSKAVLETGLKMAKAMHGVVPDDVLKASLDASFKPEEVKAIMAELNE